MRHRTKDEILSSFKKYCDLIGQTPKLPIYKKQKGLPSVHSIINNFGSWQNILTECGLKSTKKEYTIESLTEELHRVRDISKPKYLTSTLIDNNSPISLETFYRKIGKMNEIRKLLEIKNKKKHHLTEKQLLKNSKKYISKKTRWCVLKRDNFTCQYCGSKAPNAVLHVDHRKSIYDGGCGNITNLITSCESCNLGKSKESVNI